VHHWFYITANKNYKLQVTRIPWLYNRASWLSMTCYCPWQPWKMVLLNSMTSMTGGHSAWRNTQSFNETGQCILAKVVFTDRRRTKIMVFAITNIHKIHERSLYGNNVTPVQKNTHTQHIRLSLNHQASDEWLLMWLGINVVHNTTHTSSDYHSS